MVVDGEGFLGQLIVDLKSEQRRVGLEDLHQAVAKLGIDLAGLSGSSAFDDLSWGLAIKQRPIICTGQGVAAGHPRNGSVLPV